MDWPRYACLGRGRLVTRVWGSCGQVTIGYRMGKGFIGRLPLAEVFESIIGLDLIFFYGFFHDLVVAEQVFG